MEDAKEVGGDQATPYCVTLPMVQEAAERIAPFVHLTPVSTFTV
jgi:hypothetical protein